jgi:hypothetical protein
VTEALRFLAIAELIGLAALPLAGTVLGRLPGAGLGFAKPLGLLLVAWLVWIGGSLEIVPYTTASAIVAVVVVALAGLACALGLRRGPPKQRWWRAPRPGARAAGARSVPLAAADRRRGRLRRDVLRDGAARRLLARRLEHREADGHGLHQRAQPEPLVPTARPVAGRRRSELLLLRPPGDGDRGAPH